MEVLNKHDSFQLQKLKDTTIVISHQNKLFDKKHLHKPFVQAMNTNKKIVQEQINYSLLKNLSKKADYTQRELAKSLDISLGKLNYCLTELVKKGFVKIDNFKKSDKKIGYLYYLTPQGMEEKVRVTYHFLKRKTQEYEELKNQIAEIKREISGQ